MVPGDECMLIFTPLLSCFPTPLPALFSRDCIQNAGVQVEVQAALPPYDSADLAVLEASVVDKNTVWSLGKPQRESYCKIVGL